MTRIGVPAVPPGTHVDTTTDQRADGVKTFAELRVSAGRPWYDVRDVIRNVAAGADVAAAINAVISPGGVVLVVPPNTDLSVGAALTPGSNSEIRLMGPTATITRRTNTPYPLIQVTGAVGAPKTNVHLVGNGGKLLGFATALVAGALGINLRGCTDSSVEGFDISGQPGDGIGLDNVANKRCRVIRNDVHGIYGHGLTFTGGSEEIDVLYNKVWDALNASSNAFIMGYGPTVSTRCQVLGNRARNAGSAGFQLSALEDSTVAFNRVQGMAHAFISDLCEDIILAFNKARQLTTAASLGSAFYLGMVDSLVAFNTIDTVAAGTGAGHGMRILAACDSVRLVQNVLRDVAGNSMLIEGIRSAIIANEIMRGGAIGMQLWGSQYTRATENTIRDCVGTAIHLANGPNFSRVSGGSISNAANAGPGTQKAVDIGAYTANCFVGDIDIHNFAGPRYTKHADGTSTTVVRDDQRLAPATYTATNALTDRTFDANATTVDELADVVGTLIADLRSRGVVA